MPFSWWMFKSLRVQLISQPYGLCVEDGDLGESRTTSPPRGLHQQYSALSLKRDSRTRKYMPAMFLGSLVWHIFPARLLRMGSAEVPTIINHQLDASLAGSSLKGARFFT